VERSRNSAASGVGEAGARRATGSSRRARKWGGLVQRPARAYLEANGQSGVNLHPLRETFSGDLPLFVLFQSEWI
jgi:hypothetical protein